MARPEGQGPSPKEQKELTCPACGQPLIPVYQLPQRKIKHLQDVEIREQLYCKKCDRRFALEEVLRPRQ